MYGVYDTAAEVTSYLDAFTSRGLPIIVGEFGHDHSDGNPDEDTIMAYTRAQGIGWFAWSWSGNGGGVEYLDMVAGFDPAQRTAWGNRVITGPDGLAETSVRARVFADVSS
jgi:mannan endo-1,4-beta-mannosidase